MIIKNTRFNLTLSILIICLLFSNFVFSAEVKVFDNAGLIVEDVNGKIIVIEVKSNHKSTIFVNDVITGLDRAKIETIDQYKKFINDKQKEFFVFRVIRNGVDEVHATKNLNFFNYDTSANAVSFSNNKAENIDTENGRDVQMVKAKEKCVEMGFKPDTTELSNCILKLYAIELEQSKTTNRSYTNDKSSDEQLKLLKEQNERQKSEAIMKYLQWQNNPATWGNPSNVRIVP